MLLAQKAYAEGALALCLYVARVSDDGRSAPDPVKREEAKMLLDLLTPIAKSWPSEWGLVANDLAIQVHGGYGYTREYDVEQFYRDNRLNPIHEGTTGVQALDLLDRKTRAHDGAAMDLLSQRIAETVRASEAVADLAASARTLGEAWLRLFTITRELHAIGNAELRTANAVAYLQAFGHIVVGWLWLDQAVVARAALAEAIATTPNFYLGKLSACRFYFAWEMPKVAAWFKVLGPVERTPLDMADVWF
jgi:hypothetical protein